MFKKYQLRSYNFRLVILLIVTSVYGIAVINSADSSYTIKQCAGLLLSLFVMVVVSLIDYNWLLRFYWIMYALNFVLLVLVLALGSESKGAQRWINIGGFRFQQKVCIHKAGHVNSPLEFHTGRNNDFSIPPQHLSYGKFYDSSTPDFFIPR